MQRANRVIAVVAVLGTMLANAGVLQAVHMHQHSVRCCAPAGSGPAGSHPAGSHHDPDTCTLCLQFASGNKTVSPDFGLRAGFTPEMAQDVVFARTFVLPRVSLSSSPARAPPSLCL